MDKRKHSTHTHRPSTSQRPPSDDAQSSRSTTPSGNLTRRVEFEGRTVTAVYFRDRWVWPAAQVGDTIGYEDGARLVDKIRGEWSDEFVEGKDYELLKGAPLKAFREVSPDSGETSKFAGRLLILTESGIDLALVLAKTEKGRRLRRLLVDHILPQLRATGSATLPGAPSPGLDPEMLARLIDEKIAARLASLNPMHDGPVLHNDDRAVVLDPILTLAKRVAGADATKRDIARERGRIEHRVRDAVKWTSRWCLLPRVQTGAVCAALARETSIADQFEKVVAKTRQGSLRLVPPKKDAK